MDKACSKCLCDPYGSRRDQGCESIGGQCPCLPGVIGRRCDMCREKQGEITRNGKGCNSKDLLFLVFSSILSDTVEPAVFSGHPLPYLAVTPLPYSAVTPLPYSAVTPLPYSAVTPWGLRKFAHFQGDRLKHVRLQKNISRHY